MRKGKCNTGEKDIEIVEERDYYEVVDYKNDEVINYENDVDVDVDLLI